jgi:hypothetical protein
MTIFNITKKVEIHRVCITYRWLLQTVDVSRTQCPKEQLGGHVV